MIATLLRRHAYRTGAFCLSSGRQTSEYLDVKSALLAPGVGVEIAIAAYKAMVGSLGNATAGVELGGALLAWTIAIMHHQPCLIVRKGERSHGVDDGGVIGLDNLPGNASVWLVEDVVTTGKSVMAAIERLARFRRLCLVGVLAVVDREEGGMDMVREAVSSCGNVKVVNLTTLSEIRAAKG